MNERLKPAELRTNSAADDTASNYQNDFLNWLTALDERSGGESELAQWVKPEYLHRLETYQSSYLGRVTANLSDTLFEACENLFGKELVAQVLAGFFKENPPRASALTSAADTLPARLRATHVEREALLFADLAEICIVRWKVLTGEDPPQRPFDSVGNGNANIDLSAVYLSPQAHVVWPCAQHDLSEAWMLAQSTQSTQSTQSAQSAQASTVPEHLFNNVTGVILAKSSPTDFHVIAVPGGLEGFVRGLAAGFSVEQAIEKLEQQLETLPDSGAGHAEIAGQLQNLMHALTLMRIIRPKIR